MKVDLDIARWLKEQGYPQEQWPQMVHWRYQSEYIGEWRIGYHRLPPQPITAEYVHQSTTWTEFLAAPHPVDALEWLEREKGWDWQTSVKQKRRWRASLRHSGTLWADTAADLLMFIKEHMELLPLDV